jgi:hypothetical protein
MRKKVLEQNMKLYSCCQGYFDEFWKVRRGLLWLSLSAPALMSTGFHSVLLLQERLRRAELPRLLPVSRGAPPTALVTQRAHAARQACCCSGPSVSSTRMYVQDKFVSWPAPPLPLPARI